MQDERKTPEPYFKNSKTRKKRQITLNPFLIVRKSGGGGVDNSSDFSFLNLPQTPTGLVLQREEHQMTFFLNYR